VKCEICGKEFKRYKSLSCHLRKHNTTSKEYYDKFLKKNGEGICPVCGKETNFYGMKKGYAKFCSNRCANSKENNPMWGKHCSEEAKQKISIANKGEKNHNYGKHLSEETKKKLSQANKGKHHSEETKKKISDAHKGEKNSFYGKHHTEKTKKKLSDANKGENHPNYGKHLSEETKKKISDANKGKHCSEETRKKLSDANKGKHCSEETKKKISDANKGKLKGENNPNYKDGISLKKFKNAFGMEPEEWKKLAQEIRERDNFTCQYCGKKGATDVHHIIPRRIKIDNSPENLITLCRSCHIKIEHLTDEYLAQGKDPRKIFYKK
jgi:5-methylcytosine-specific restriction endonuclease McrA